MAIELRVNGREHALDVDGGRSLLGVLRDELGLPGTKGGCGEGECGACTVLLDGVPTHACRTTVGEVAGRAVTTIEGLVADPATAGPALRQAFVEEGAMQCAFCTPGMVMAAAGLLAGNPRPSEADIVAGMNGNICRCGTYPRIVRAVRRAAELLANGGPAPAQAAAGGLAGARGDVVAADPDPEHDATMPLGDFLAHEIQLRGEAGEEVQTVWLPAGGLVAVRVESASPIVPSTGRQQQSGGMAAGPESIAAWVHVAEDGRVTGFTGKVEVGQGNRTSLAQMIADELRVPFERVRLVMGDTARTPWDMGTFGSLSTPQAGTTLRETAAAARDLLAGGASGVCIVRGDVALKPATEWLAGGAPQPRVGAGALAGGEQRYTSDMRLPGMLVGKVLRPPRAGARLVRADASAARTLPGVVVAEADDFLAVAAPSPGLAQHALASVKAEWAGGSSLSSPGLFEHLRATAQPAGGPGQSEWGGPVHMVRGDPEAALRDGEHVLDRTYTIAYIAHVPLEPRAALATWDGDDLTVWTGTQRPFTVRDELAEAFGLAEEQVRVLVPDTGSGYGGKHTPECALEAARLSRAASRPVRVVWTREEEFRWAYFRPAGVIDVRSAARADGTITGFVLDNINSGSAGIRTPYAWPSERLLFRPADSPFRQGSYRALAATANHFARELHLDEVAERLGIDPVELRLRNLESRRARAVLEAACERFGWSGAVAPVGAAGASRRGSGIALGWEKGSYVATAVEIEVPEPWSGSTAAPGTPGLRVLRAVSAFDCGAVVNPDNLRNQIEGALIMGLGGALFEAIDFEQGVVSNARLSQYRVPRFSDVPAIETVVLDRKDERPVGAGETPIVAIAPALGAAIARATGVRPTGMPMAR